MGVSLTKIPKTPAEVAGAVLDAIERQPSAFDMTNWAHLVHGNELRPEDRLCGTTLCAAGWAAHLTGWTIARTPRGEFVTLDGDEVNIYAEREGVRRQIEDVAADALGLDAYADGGWFFYSTSGVAVLRLREIAGRA